jgi:murein tripeptide amidase MpaA
LKITKLCSSLGGLDVPLLFIHEDIDEISFDETERKADKKCIIISGRAHPGESNGSYMMEGFISFLCGNSKIAKILRHNIIFKIVPMLNPDGVALGNYRTGLSGKDFNR